MKVSDSAVRWREGTYEDIVDMYLIDTGEIKSKK